MIAAYSTKNGTLTPVPIAADQTLPEDAIWIDALDPTADEENRIENMLGLDVPNREEMQEIEISSRLYQDGGALIMTATLIVGSDTDSPMSVPVTFVLAGHRLVTLRYATPLPFHAYAAQVQRQGASCFDRRGRVGGSAGFGGGPPGRHSRAGPARHGQALA